MTFIKTQNQISIKLFFCFCLLNVFSCSQNKTDNTEAISSTPNENMLNLLKQISDKLFLLNENDFTNEQLQSKWAGNKPATDEEIAAAEKKLGVKLPADYIEFLKISNGFFATSSVSPSFMPIDKIDYLKILDEQLIDIWGHDNRMDTTAVLLSKSILIGGLGEEQYFLLIPPQTPSDKWRYWKFASWIPGENPYNSLTEFFSHDLDLLKMETADLKAPKPKFVTDYSLRDAVFNLDWKKTTALCLTYLKEDKQYAYYNKDFDLFSLLLVSAGKEGKYNELEATLQELKEQQAKGMFASSMYLSNERLLNTFQQTARKKEMFLPGMQEIHKFVVESDPKTAEEIENDMGKDGRNRMEKLSYILSLLYSYGNAKEFMDLYEKNEAELDFQNHLDAAQVYATVNQTVKAKNALIRYFSIAMDYRPFDPFLNEALLPLIDHDLMSKIQFKSSKK